MPWIALQTANAGRTSLKAKHHSRVRFLVDESLGRDAVRALREYGWNAKFVSDLNLGKDDSAVFAEAWKQRGVRMIGSGMDAICFDIPTGAGSAVGAGSNVIVG